MVAFLKTLSFNPADFSTPPLPATDMKTGEGVLVYDQDLPTETDSRITLPSDGPHQLITSLRPAREGDIRVVFSLFTMDFSLIAREEIPLPVLVAEYDAVLPARPFLEEELAPEENNAQRPHLAPALAEQIESRVAPLIQKKIEKWFSGKIPHISKIIGGGLAHAIWDLRQMREKRLRLQIKENKEQKNIFGGKHRAYHDRQSS